MWRCHLPTSRYPGIRKSLHAILDNSYRPNSHHVSDAKTSCRSSVHLQAVQCYEVRAHLGNEESCSERCGEYKSERIACCSVFTNTKFQQDTLLFSVTSQSSRGYPLLRSQRTHGKSCRLTLDHINGRNSANMEHWWRPPSTQVMGRILPHTWIQ